MFGTVLWMQEKTPSKKEIFDKENDFCWYEVASKWMIEHRSYVCLCCDCQKPELINPKTKEWARHDFRLCPQHSLWQRWDDCQLFYFMTFSVYVQKHNIYHRNDSVESYSVHVYVRFWFHAKAPQKNKLIRKEHI